MKNRRQYIKDMEFAIKELRTRGRPTDEIERHLAHLKAIYPNKETYIDLHELYLQQSEEPLYPLYVTKAEVFMMQILGYVPDYNSKLFKELKAEYERDFADFKNRFR